MWVETFTSGRDGSAAPGMKATKGAVLDDARVRELRD
jgi:hypothetical protein